MILKEKNRKYKEKLQKANDKIMVLLEEKLKNKENLINSRDNQLETNRKIIPTEIVERRGPSLSLLDIQNIRIINENRVLRENAKRFSQNLLKH